MFDEDTAWLIGCLTAISLLLLPAAEAAPSSNLDPEDTDDPNVRIRVVPASAGSDWAQAEGSAACNGLAPVQVSCLAWGTFDAEADSDDEATFELVFAPGSHFQGVIENSGGTESGTWNAECFVLLPGFEPSCDVTFSGTFHEGQGYGFQGRSDRLSTGFWETGVVDG